MNIHAANEGKGKLYKLLFTKRSVTETVLDITLIWQHYTRVSQAFWLYKSPRKSHKFCGLHLTNLSRLHVSIKVGEAFIKSAQTVVTKTVIAVMTLNRRD